MILAYLSLLVDLGSAAVVVQTVLFQKNPLNYRKNVYKRPWEGLWILPVRKGPTSSIPTENSHVRQKNLNSHRAHALLTAYDRTQKPSRRSRISINYRNRMKKFATNHGIKFPKQRTQRNSTKDQHKISSTIIAIHHVWRPSPSDLGVA